MFRRPVASNASYARGDPQPTYRVLHDDDEVDESTEGEDESGCCGCAVILIGIPAAIAVAWWLGWLNTFWQWTTEIICELCA